MNLKVLHSKHGQSIWLDHIRQHLLQSGELARRVKEDDLRGITSNPSIFEKAIAGSTDYTAALQSQELRQKTAVAIYEHLAIDDLQQAADLLRPVYVATDRNDGYVSMEVSPYLAHDTEGTVAEAVRLWKALARDNAMIKVPATREGIPAIRRLTAQGINVNVTLLFSRAVCAEVFEAYMQGLEMLAARGGNLAQVASVASMFVSRLDVIVTPLLETIGGADEAPALIGKVAIANAKLAYQDWKERCRSARWQALAARKAKVQRLLWASTSTKDPRFSDVMYVESLIGPDTVDTMTPATLEALRDHGHAKNHLEEYVEGAARTLATLAGLNISLDDLTATLLDEGVRDLSASFDKLLGEIEKKRDAALTPSMNRLSYRLPAPHFAQVNDTLEDWRARGKVRKLWGNDVSLWTSDGENEWLGWLNLAEAAPESLGVFAAFAAEVQRDFSFAVVLGMGGSSLCPEVLARTFPKNPAFPHLFVLDSTDPAQIRTLESRIDLAKTLFIVSSKSGTTLEPDILKDYFFDRLRQLKGDAAAAMHFVAVTDPGTALQKVAQKQHWRAVFYGSPDVGGRYSALSSFGMVPAAVMGIDVPRFLDRAAIMAHACAACVPPEQNPGVMLGVVLGASAKGGRDKVTLVASPGIEPLGAWLEQLLAESTGKEGRGLIPIDREPLGPPDGYGDDRLFIYLRLNEDAAQAASQDAAIAELESTGHPVVRIAIEDRADLGQEFFLWEFATAVAGAVLEINPFDQPDVEASKAATRKLTQAYEKNGALPSERPFHREGHLALFADERNHVALERAAGSTQTLHGYLRAHLERLQPGDYLALLAYLERNDRHDAALQAIRKAVRDKRRVATCTGFGPRFLHSTGQAFKGGPPSGVFLQLTCDDANDLPIPGRRYGFSIVKAAQARADFRVLAERHRRALRIHLGTDVVGGLELLRSAIVAVLT